MGDEIYLCGGEDEDGNDSFIMEVYNTQTDTWSRGPNMSTKCSGCASAVFCNWLFVLGGQNQDSDGLRSVNAYDAESKKWIRLQSMIQARTTCGAAIVEGKLMVVGGSVGNRANLNSTEYLKLHELVASKNNVCGPGRQDKNQCAGEGARRRDDWIVLLVIAVSVVSIVMYVYFGAQSL